MSEPTLDRDALIHEHLPLCQHVLAGVAARFPRHADRDELAQAARLGLVEAAHRYDAARGVPFERWAALRIRGAILDAVRAIDFAPRTLRHAMRDVESAREALERELGRAPTLAERADRVGMTADALSTLEGRAHRALVVSLDASDARDDEAGSTLAGTLVDRTQRDPLAVLEDVERDSYLRDALTLLPARLRDVVGSYFLDGEPSSAIAARLGVTESRVSQLRSEALALLRVALAAQYDDDVAATPRQLQFAAQVGAQRGYRERVTLVPAPRTPADGSETTGQPRKSARLTGTVSSAAATASR